MQAKQRIWVEHAACSFGAVHYVSSLGADDRSEVAEAENCQTAAAMAAPARVDLEHPLLVRPHDRMHSKHPRFAEASC